jgi:RHS repeat-associated protein
MGMTNRSFSVAPPVCSWKNVRESEDQLSQVSVFSYDNNGNQVSFRDANNVGQDCVYDARNRDTQCADTMGSVTKKFYDAHSNLVKTTDALLKDNLCAYDARDRKINCTDRLGGVTQYAYDANNNLTTLTDAQNGVTSYIFDPRNLLIVETYPDTRSRTYSYDAIRRLIKRVDQSNAATAYVYDHAGRMIERVYPAGTGNDTFVYDNASRLTSAASAQYNNAVNRIYDAASRLTSETLTVGATPYSIGYGYDADNRQTQVIYPNGAVVDRTFTDRNQLESVAYNGVNAAILNYDNAGRLNTKTFGNGLIETKTYQADNLNTSINTPGVTNFAYTWDANKRKLSQTETGIPLNNQNYSYDDEDRLAAFNRNNGDNQAWNLSLVGDWNQFNNNGNVENRTHNAVHEITTVDATPLVHDVKGNLTQNKNGQVYAWDIENRLTTATVPAGCADGVTGTHTYTYDALGRRVSKNVGGNTTVFVSDGMQEIAEYVNGAFSQSYVYGSYIDEPLLKTDSAGNKIYYHANNLFSIAALTDNAGTVVERYKYDPYGKATVLAADGITVRLNSLHGNRVGHTGRTKDDETGLMYYRIRQYSPELGRFISGDMWRKNCKGNHTPCKPSAGDGYPDGYNRYFYVAGRPLSGLDPFGLCDAAQNHWPEMSPQERTDRFKPFNEMFDSKNWKYTPPEKPAIKYWEGDNVLKAPTLIGYGIYCGPGRPAELRGANDQRPIDCLDACCRQHDYCYKQYGTSYSYFKPSDEQRACDLALVYCAIQCKLEGRIRKEACTENSAIGTSYITNLIGIFWETAKISKTANFVRPPELDKSPKLPELANKGPQVDK